jgi:hypothetical protein
MFDKDKIFRSLIVKEFRKEYLSAGRQMSVPHSGTKGIVILSGCGFIDSQNIDNPDLKNQEEIARIKFAHYIWKRVCWLKDQQFYRPSWQYLLSLQFSDYKEKLPPRFILNGTTEQLPGMKRVALKVGVPEKYIILVDCGKYGIANTKTQFTAITEHFTLSRARCLTFISSGYHIPRINRTAAANLPGKLRFQCLGIPFGIYLYNIPEKVLGELRRIVDFSKKGDIVKYPPPYPMAYPR